MIARWNCLPGMRNCESCLPSSSTGWRVARRSVNRRPRKRTTAAGWDGWPKAVRNWSGRPCGIRSSTPAPSSNSRRTCRTSRRWPSRGCQGLVNSCRTRRRRRRSAKNARMASQEKSAKNAAASRTRPGTARRTSRPLRRRRRSSIKKIQTIRRTSRRSRPTRKMMVGAAVVVAHSACRLRRWAMSRKNRATVLRRRRLRKNCSTRRSRSSGSCSRISRRSPSSWPT